MFYDDDDFCLRYARTIEEIPDDIYDKLMNEYDPDEFDAYINRDDELLGMDIDTFVNLYRIDVYEYYVYS